MNNPTVQEWREKHYDYLISYALEHIPERVHVEKLVEGTFQVALASQATFSSDNALRKWLTAILKNKITDWILKNISQG